MAFDQLFRSLLPFEWRSGNGTVVQFPIRQMRVSLQHDIATHGVWGRDGERQEATGRKSLTFTATIPFRNGIVPGPTEKWGVLYPDAYRAFLRATADRSTGVLQHPELGEFTCKTRSVESDWKAEARDGCDVEVQWVETLDPGSADAIDQGDSPADAVLSALTLDNEISASATRFALTRAGYLNRPGSLQSLTDLANSIASIGDKVSLLEQRQFGKIDKIFKAVDTIEDSASRPGKTATSIIRKATQRVKEQGDRVKRVRDLIDDPLSVNAAESALNWPIREQCNILRNLAIDLRKTLLRTGKTVVLFSVPRDCTLASLVTSTGAKLTDLVKLNPGLVRKPAVKRGTIVRYYSDAER